MSKRNVAYIKPEEPNFLKRIKEQVGYKEGPTVDTKRENLGPVPDEDLEDTLDEQPTVVVLRPGDLTAEEAAVVDKQLQKEAEETPADLSKPIVFKAKPKPTTEEGDSVKDKGTKSGDKRSSSSSSKDDSRKSKKLKNKALLSFNQEEEEEEY